MASPTIDTLQRHLDGHVARGRREQVSLSRIRAELDRLDQPLDEHADPVHVTGSAIVVSARGILLHRHKRLGLWLQPGGHVDPGEAPWDAALREAGEETGIVGRHCCEPPSVVHVDVHPGGRGHIHLDLRYLLTSAPEDPAPADDESQDVEWFSLPRARRLADPGLADVLERRKVLDALMAAGYCA